MIGTNSEALAHYPDLFLFDLSSIWFQIQLHGQQKFKKKKKNYLISLDRFGYSPITVKWPSPTVGVLGVRLTHPDK